ncbi:MAG: hypothetical protein ACOX6P_10595 [Candidatus Merdivicinus sp.]|jgi:hypothetical protein
MPIQYHGNYLKKDRQPIQNQTWLEKLAESVTTHSIWNVAPILVMELGGLILYLIFQIWEENVPESPSLIVYLSLVVLSFGFPIFTLIIEILGPHMVRSKKEPVYQYIRQHPNCTFSNILNACFSFKITKLLTDTIHRLDAEGKIVAEIESSRITFRLPTQEDFARWEEEAEAEAAEWSETWE